MTRSWQAIIYGPAYLDRVLRVDGPLRTAGAGGPIDESIDGRMAREDDEPRLELHDEAGPALSIRTPSGWPGPFGLLRMSGRLWAGERRVEPRQLDAISWHDDLGGMGAGYAAALGGTLVSALGDVNDPMSRAIEAHLLEQRIAHRPIRIAGRAADWTLLVSSGPHGDKLAIGFRGCHAAVESFTTDHDAQLVVVAGLPIARCEPPESPRMDPDRVRLFAPSIRNMADPRDRRCLMFANVLSCNRREWETLPQEDRAALERTVTLIAVTDGPRGAWLRAARGTEGDTTIELPAFPRTHPPRDTNRTGEAFASTLISTLLDSGWRPLSSLPSDEFRHAAIRASAAAALVLDIGRFGFPSAEAIDAAVERGIVHGPTSRASEDGGPLQ
jgi:ribokinase